MYENWMHNNESPHNLQQYQQQQHHTQGCLHANELQKERMETKPLLTIFKPL
jgi:hypothetical protein